MIKNYLLILSVVSLSYSFPLRGQNKEQLIKKGKPFLINIKDNDKFASTGRTTSDLNHILDLSPNDKLVSTSSTVAAKVNKTGFSSQQYQQYHNGIKVEYGIVRTNFKSNQLISVSGEVYEIPEALGTAPSISEQAALTAALTEVGAETYRWEIPEEEDALKKEFGSDSSYYPKGSLVFVRVFLPGNGKKEGDMALAYKFDVYAVKPLTRKLIYVDSHTGRVIHINAIIKHVDGIASTRYSGQRTISTSPRTSGGGFWLRDATRSSGVETYNMNNGILYSEATDFFDNDNNWTSAEHDNAKKNNAALDAHWGSMKTYDFFKEKFDRDSYDDLGTKIRSYVHFDVGYVNAFWNGAVMTYGDGAGDIDPLTSIDICAHEIGHAVCSSTANLVYWGESGALNESLSDIWGAVIERYAAPEKSTWLLGEDINFVIRSLANPNAYGQPDTYLGNMWDPWEAVHTNSGVMNHWFYILVEGKTGVDDNGVAYAVEGIGFDKATEIVYLMETNYLTANSRYADARLAALQAATDLFGASSNELRQTRAAWNAVGVYSANSAPADLTAAATSNTSVSLSWTDRAEDETGFVIERSVSLNTGFTEIGTVGANVTSYNDQNLPTNTIYYYRVKATFDDEPSTYSDVATVAVGQAPVAMSSTTLVTCQATLLDPGGLSDYANNQNIFMRLEPGEAGKKIKLSFTSFDLAIYDNLSIYDGEVAQQNLIGSFTGTELPADVNATNTAGVLTLVFQSNWFQNATGFQATVSCESIPAAPSVLTASTASITQINLSWNNNSSDGTAIRVQRKVTGSTLSFATIATLGADASSYQDSGLPTNQRYSYRVQALKGTTFSEYSNVATGTVGSPPLVMSNGRFEVCNTSFLDPGGEGDYQNNLFVTTTIVPSEANKAIQVSFTSFTLESCCDYLSIYDGDDTSAPLLGTYYGFGGNTPPTLTASNPQGTLTFRFYSDYSVVYSGWHATLNCVTRPSAPTNLAISSSNNSQVSLTWQYDGTDDAEIILERKVYSSSTDYETIATLPRNTTTYSDDDIADNERYYYRARAVSSGLTSSYSNIVEITIGSLPIVMRNETLTTCSGVFMDPGGNSNHDFWDEKVMTLVPSELGKKLKISFSSFNLGQNASLSIYDGSSTTASLIGVFTGHALPAAINALNNDGALTFHFRSFDYQGFGWTATLDCVTLPNAPSNLVAQTATTSQIDLSWDDNSYDETGFVIERKAAGTPGTDYARVVTLGPNVTAYSDAGLVSNNRYFYRVRSLKGTSYSPASNAVSAVVGIETYIMQDGEISACGGRFFDPGGAGNYSAGFTTMSIHPLEAGAKAKVSFTQFSLGITDHLYIYDGNISSENLIGSFSGTTIPPDINALNDEGYLTFMFERYSSGQGWRADLSCESLPAAPSDLTASAISDTHVHLSWTDNATDETGFAIERVAGSVPNEDFLRVALLPSNTTSFDDEGLDTNERYKYRVRALKGTTYGRASVEASAVVGTETVPMRSGIYDVCDIIFTDPGGAGSYEGYGTWYTMLKPTDPGKKIKISFTQFELGAYDELYVYDGEAYYGNLIGRFTGTDLPPDMNALNLGGGLSFIFSSYYGNGAAGWSAAVTCVEVPDAPSSLTATAVSTTQIDLHWADNSSHESGFAIERRAGSLTDSQFAQIATVNSNATNFSDNGLLTDDRYYYRVRALDGTVYSAPSNETSSVVGTESIVMTYGDFSTCGAVFYDPGGQSNYSSYTYRTMTIYPEETGKKVQISFSEFNLSEGDYLYIYDGYAYSENLIGQFSGTSIPTTVNATGQQGSLTFIFSSSWRSGIGWRATLSCVAVPSAPGNLSANAVSDNQINLSWTDNSSSETGYIVERRAQSQVPSLFSPIATVATNATNYVDGGLPTNERYYYRVRAVIGEAYSAPSNETSALLGSESIIMTYGSVSTCSAVFYDPGGTSDYASYDYKSMAIYPAETGKKLRVTFSEFGLSPGDYLSVYDGSIYNGDLVGQYMGNTLPPDIHARNPEGYLTFVFSSSWNSNVGWTAAISCYEPPAVPTNLSASVNANLGVNLNWLDNSSTETGFVIERWWMAVPGIEGFYTIATVGANVTTYVDTDTTENRVCIYRIAAVDGVAKSAYSNTAGVVVGDAPITMTNATISTCDAGFFDSGYTQNYFDNESQVLTVRPSHPGAKLKASFSSFQLESCCDALSVFDGPSINSPLIGQYYRTPPEEIKATNSEGSLTFWFRSDFSVTEAGWDARLVCTYPNPVITFDHVTKTYSAVPFTLNASSYPGAELVYSVMNDPLNTAEVTLTGIHNQMVTVEKAGTVKLKATLAATADHPLVEQVATLTVNKAGQVLTFEAIEDKLNTAEPFSLLAQTDSNLPVTFTLLSGPANLTGNTVTLTKALGNVTIKAEQIGNDNYLPVAKENTFDVLLDPVLAVADDHGHDEINMWPVPATDFLQVDVGNLAQSDIFVADGLGRRLMNVTPFPDGKFQLDLRQVVAGTYFLVINTSRKVMLKRFIVIKD